MTPSTNGAPRKGRRKPVPKKSVAATVRRLRDDRGLTQVDLAYLTGMSTGYIGMLENGARKNPGTRMVAKLASALNVTVADFRAAAGLDDEDTPPVAVSPEAAIMSDPDLDPEAKTALVDLLTVLRRRA